MNRSLFTQRRVLLIVVAVLLISSLAGRSVGHFVGSPLSGVVATLTAPPTIMARVVSETIRPASIEPAIERTPEEIRHQADVYEHVISALQEEVISLQREVAEMRNAQQIVSYEGYRPVRARVISYNGDADNPILTIARGTADGIDEGMIADWYAKLVGEVVGAARHTAQVRLMTHEDARFRVVLKAADPEAVPFELEEMVVLGEDGESFVVDVPRDHPVRIGDIAHLWDDRFPPSAQGRIVGRVAATPELGDIRFKRVVIRSTLPLTQMPRVDVLVPAGERSGEGGAVR